MLSFSLKSTNWYRDRSNVVIVLLIRTVEFWIRSLYDRYGRYDRYDYEFKFKKIIIFIVMTIHPLGSIQTAAPSHRCPVFPARAFGNAHQHILDRRGWVCPQRSGHPVHRTWPHSRMSAVGPPQNRKWCPPGSYSTSNTCGGWFVWPLIPSAPPVPHNHEVPRAVAMWE